LDEVSTVYGDSQIFLRCALKSQCSWRTAFDVIQVLTAVSSGIQILSDMAFLVDITSHLDQLNMQLQGRGQTVSDLYTHINAFQRKPVLFKEDFPSDYPNLENTFPPVKRFAKISLNARKHF